MNSGIIDSVLSKRGVVAKLAKLPYYSYLPSEVLKKGQHLPFAYHYKYRNLYLRLHWIFAGVICLNSKGILFDSILSHSRMSA